MPNKLTDVTDNNVGKMTDTEIKKALEHEIEIAKTVGDNTAYIVEMSVLTNALDLINRQEEENENLTEKNSNLTSDLTSLQNDLTSAKADIEKLTSGKCVYLSDDETIEYCVEGPCPNYKTVAQIKAEAYKEFAKELEDICHFAVCNARGKCKLVERKNLKWYVDNILLKLAGDKNAG